jgi:hypothetical protein
VKYHMPGDDDLGSAISLEDALSIMVVVFVLFLILFIPLVNLDRANLERAQKLDVWRTVHSYLQENVEVTPKAMEYSNVFDQVIDATNRITRVSRNVVYLESVKGDNLLVLEHNTQTNNFIGMYIQNFSSTITYREGRLQWDRFDSKWFAEEQGLDYGSRESSVQMRDRYKKWIADTRGIVEETIVQEEG